MAEARGRPVPVSVDKLRLFVTVSDGEGSGSVAVSLWCPREPGFRTRVTQVELPAAWRERWLATHPNDIIEIEAAAPILALQTWPDLG